MFEESSDGDIRKLMDYVLPHSYQVSASMHGTRAMQTLIEVLASRASRFHPELVNLIAELSQRVVELAVHTHGNHVIQAFLTSFRASEKPSDPDTKGSEQYEQYTQFIFDACIANCVDIGK